MDSIDSAMRVFIARQLSTIPPVILATFREMREQAPSTWAATSTFDQMLRPYMGAMPFDTTDSRIIEAVCRRLDSEPSK